MKTVIVVLVVLLMLGVVFPYATSDTSDTVTVLELPRYIGDKHNTTVSRLHDSQSGIEILCFYSYDGLEVSTGISCVPTGRKW